MTGQAGARELLAAERADTLERLSGLERELRGIIESSGSAGTDDEHDPEGATVAFERQHVAALIGQQTYQPAWGANKKAAEQRAAQNALYELEGKPVPDEAD